MKETLQAKLTSYGQQHLLGFWDQLDQRQQGHLAAQIDSVDFDLLERLVRGGGSEVDWQALADRAAPPQAIRLDDSSPRFSETEAQAHGEQALRAGQIAIVLVAGGQGTRLGFEHVKGMYPIGPVSEASLFQLLVEKIRAIARRYQTSIPLCVMTSPATDVETRQFFAEHANFGMAESDLHFFCQGTMPAVDAETGQLLLETPSSLAMSPDGHGGTVAALARDGILDHLATQGIQQVFYFQVDNVLTPICDPQILGYHLLAESELTSLAVAKQEPEERVGNVVLVDGHLQIIEYSDLPCQAAERRAADGSLELWAGNIAVHVFDLAFLQRMAEGQGQLHFHRAHKKVSYVGADGQAVEPAEPNALKFEKFIFDLLPAARNALVVEVDGARTFAALKNAPGAPRETADWVREQLVNLHCEWLRAAGAQVVDDCLVEISPLFALDAEELATKLEPELVVSETTYFSAAAIPE